jgi:microsomal dipeptidase-like Zn-dependent dipeptidase
MGASRTYTMHRTAAISLKHNAGTRVCHLLRSAVLRALCLCALTCFTSASAQVLRESQRNLTVELDSSLQDRNFDFEDGLRDWIKSGVAFDSQPIDGAIIQTDRVNAVKLGGDYWRGISYPVGHHGHYLIMTDDNSIGTLTSIDFILSESRRYLSFLIAGSEDISHERLELQVLVSSENEASTLENQIVEWMMKRHLSEKHIRAPVTDGQYVVAVSETGDNLDLLQQKTIEIPRFLLGHTARLKIIDASSSAHIDVDFIRFSANPPNPYRAPVWGYADYHTHPMSYMGFGALNGVHTLWGQPGRSYDSYVNDQTLISRDIPKCIKGHGGGPLAEVFINQSEERIHLDGVQEELRDFLLGRLTGHKRSGGPDFTNFPSFLSGAHEQMHITQIRRNYDGGLRLMVAIAVHNLGAEYLASKVANGQIVPSTEREVVEAEVCEMRRLAEANDTWMQIAYSPDQAREIIRQNKLAIILGIEIDRLGELDPSNSAKPEDEVQYLWNLGIRVVTPIHAVDNRLGGASVFLDVYNWLNDFLNRGQYNLRPQELAMVPPQFFEVRDGGCSTLPHAERGECVLYHLDGEQNRVVINHNLLLTFPSFGLTPNLKSVPTPEYANFQGDKNLHGLTAYGRSYIETLMNHSMIIDTAHMSDLSVKDVFEIIGNNLVRKHPDCIGFSLNTDVQSSCYEEAYPTIISHAHFRAQSFYDEATTVKDFRPREYDISDRNIEMVRRVGGVLGPFVTEGPISPPPNQTETSFKNDCAMSSKGFGYAFRYGLQEMRGRGVGMATDFTFIPNVGPRFGREACWAYHLASNARKERSLNPGQFATDVQDKGVVYKEFTPARTVRVGNNLPLTVYEMGRRRFDFNIDGLAHYGLVPDMLQDLKNLGLPAADFEALFSSAESYVQMWEKIWRISGCEFNAHCGFVPPKQDCENACQDICPKSSNVRKLATRRQ